MGEKSSSPIAIQVGCLDHVSDEETPGYWEQVATHVTKRWKEHYNQYGLVVSPPKEDQQTYTCQICHKTLPLVFKSKARVKRDRRNESIVFYFVAVAVAACTLSSPGDPLAPIAAIAAIGVVVLLHWWRVSKAKPVLVVPLGFAFKSKEGWAGHRYWRNGKEFHGKIEVIE